MNKNSIKQSIDTIPNTLISYKGHCSNCHGGWDGKSYSTYGEAYDEVKNHENTYHHDVHIQVIKTLFTNNFCVKPILQIVGNRIRKIAYN